MTTVRLEAKCRTWPSAQRTGKFAARSLSSRVIIAQWNPAQCASWCLVLSRDSQVEAGTDSVLYVYGVSEKVFLRHDPVEYRAVNGYDDDGLLFRAFCVRISFVTHGLTIED